MRAHVWARRALILALSALCVVFVIPVSVGLISFPLIPLFLLRGLEISVSSLIV